MKSDEKSCVGCKFLYTQGRGYSNYTWLETDVDCAKDKNPNLPREEPADWNMKEDNWPATMGGRCSLYELGEMVALDVEGEDGPADCTQDEETIAAVCEHSGRGRHGGYYDSSTGG